MNNPRIISGICEFCGVPACTCPHYSGLVNEQGKYFPGKSGCNIQVEVCQDNILTPENMNKEKEVTEGAIFFDEFPNTEDKKVDIVMIKFNLPEIEREAIEKIKANTSHPYTLTVFDNYEKRFPLSDLWNTLIRMSKCEYVCLLNNDAFVSKGWLEEMMKAFNDPLCAAVGPSGDNVGGFQRELKKESIAKNYIGRFKNVDLLSGYCMIVKKSLFTEEGLNFPSEVPFYGGEHAWEITIRRAGYKMFWALSAWVSHLGESSGKKEGTVDDMRRQGQLQFVDWLASSTPIEFTTYNRLAYTKKSLPALLASQTGKIYCIDNASTDGTVEYLKDIKNKYPERIELILNDQNLKVAGAMNQFLKLTKNEEYVGKVDNDTIVKPDWLKNMLMMCLLRKIDIMQAKHHCWNSTYGSFDEWMKNLRQDTQNKHIFFSPFVGGSGIVIKRSEIKEDLPQTEWALGGWTYFQDQHPDLLKAFCDNVEIELLDMVDDNTPKFDDYPEYYQEVGRTSLRNCDSEKTMVEIMSRFGKRFAYTRFGDGELKMINGWEGRDITQFNSEKFREELKESFLINHPDYLIGNIAEMVNEKKAHPGMLGRFENDSELVEITKQFYYDKQFYSPIAFHYWYCFEPQMFDFLMKIIKKKKVALVGGEHLLPLKSILKINDFISVPSFQAYDTIDDWYGKVEAAAKKNEIMLLAIAMTSNVVQKRLWNSKIKIGTIDLGSVANALAGNNISGHSWINKAKELKLCQF